MSDVPTIRQQAVKARGLAWAAQHCLTPNPDRKPKGLNVEEALRHLEEIEQLQRAILDALDAAELISEYAGGDATEKSHWRYVPDVVSRLGASTRPRSTP